MTSFFECGFFDIKEGGRFGGEMSVSHCPRSCSLPLSLWVLIMKWLISSSGQQRWPLHFCPNSFFIIPNGFEMMALHFWAFSFPHFLCHSACWRFVNLPPSRSSASTTFSSSLASLFWLLSDLSTNYDYDGAHGLEPPAHLTHSYCFKGCIHIFIELAVLWPFCWQKATIPADVLIVNLGEVLVVLGGSGHCGMTPGPAPPPSHQVL